MLILQWDYITIDDYQLGTELLKEEKRSFPFYLNFTVQINGKIKRVRTDFTVYYFDNNAKEPYEKFDLWQLHSCINIFQELWYEVDYSKIVWEIESFVNYQMWKIKNKKMTPSRKKTAKKIKKTSSWK